MKKFVFCIIFFVSNFCFCVNGTWIDQFKKQTDINSIFIKYYEWAVNLEKCRPIDIRDHIKVLYELNVLLKNMEKEVFEILFCHHHILNKILTPTPNYIKEKIALSNYLSLPDQVYQHTVSKQLYLTECLFLDNNLPVILMPAGRYLLKFLALSSLLEYLKLAFIRFIITTQPCENSDQCIRTLIEEAQKKDVDFFKNDLNKMANERWRDIKKSEIIIFRKFITDLDINYDIYNYINFIHSNICIEIINAKNIHNHNTKEQVKFTWLIQNLYHFIEFGIIRKNIEEIDEKENLSSPILLKIIGFLLLNYQDRNLKDDTRKELLLEQKKLVDKSPIINIKTPKNNKKKKKKKPTQVKIINEIKIQPIQQVEDNSTQKKTKNKTSKKKNALKKKFTAKFLSIKNNFREKIKEFILESYNENFDYYQIILSYNMQIKDLLREALEHFNKNQQKLSDHIAFVLVGSHGWLDLAVPSSDLELLILTDGMSAELYKKFSIFLVFLKNIGFVFDKENSFPPMLYENQHTIYGNFLMVIKPEHLHEYYRLAFGKEEPSVDHLLEFHKDFTPLRYEQHLKTKHTNTRQASENIVYLLENRTCIYGRVDLFDRLNDTLKKVETTYQKEKYERMKQKYEKFYEKNHLTFSNESESLKYYSALFLQIPSPYPEFDNLVSFISYKIKNMFYRPLQIVTANQELIENLGKEVLEGDLKKAKNYVSFLRMRVEYIKYDTQQVNNIEKLLELIGFDQDFYDRNMKSIFDALDQALLK